MISPATSPLVRTTQTPTAVPLIRMAVAPAANQAIPSAKPSNAFQQNANFLTPIIVLNAGGAKARTMLLLQHLLLRSHLASLRLVVGRR